MFIDLLIGTMGSLLAAAIIAITTLRWKAKKKAKREREKRRKREEELVKKAQEKLQENPQLRKLIIPSPEEMMEYSEQGPIVHRVRERYLTVRFGQRTVPIYLHPRSRNSTIQIIITILGFLLLVFLLMMTKK